MGKARQASVEVERGKVFEFDVPADRVTSRWNVKDGFAEWMAGGDVEVSNITVRR